jgi:hypothetical protein
MSNFVLPMAEFNRIQQVIHGTIKDEGTRGRHALCSRASTH